MRSWLLYSLVRLGVLAVVFAVLMLLGLEWWLAAIFATVIALCVSVIALGRLREPVAADLAARAAQRTKPTLAEIDAADEDAQTEAQER